MATCWSILGIEADASVEEVKRAYRQLAAGAHPDTGGSTVEFVRLNLAYREALVLAESPRQCPECLGRGIKPVTRGWIIIHMMCEVCSGAGHVPRGKEATPERPLRQG